MSHFSYVNDKLPKEQPNRFIIQIFLWPALYIIAFILLPLTLGLALMSHEKKRINISKPRAKVAYNAALLGVGLLITPVWASGMMGDTSSVDPAPKPVTEQVQEVKQEEPEPVVEVKTETQEEKIKYASKKHKDNTLAKGVEYTKQEGKNGLKTYTYKVTYTDGVETDRKLIGEKITQKPVSRIVVTGTKVAVVETPSPPPPPPPPNCDENYSGACVPIASDVDCAGGSGNGPAYVRGPVYVEGTDIYRLDGDGDGVACE